jgi:uncharacterized protein YndB with AHSA1/START domain
MRSKRRSSPSRGRVGSHKAAGQTETRKHDDWNRESRRGEHAVTRYTYDRPRTSVTVKRRFNASAERVFDAWVDLEFACKWLFTNKSSTTTYGLDVRVGGKYVITRLSRGKKYLAVDEYLEIERPRRLVFTFGMPQFAADFDTVIIEIEPDGDDCWLTLTQQGLRPGYETSTRSGWGKMFDELATAVVPSAEASKKARASNGQRQVRLRGSTVSTKREDKDAASGFPPGIARPALRALDRAGYKRLDQLSRVSEHELLDLHGRSQGHRRHSRGAPREGQVVRGRWLNPDWC